MLRLRHPKWFLALGVLLLLSITVGCKRSDLHSIPSGDEGTDGQNPSGNTETVTQEPVSEETTVPEEAETRRPEVRRRVTDVLEIFPFFEEDGHGNGPIRVNSYVISGSLSSDHWMDLQVKDGQIYAHGLLYDQMWYVENYDADFQSLLTDVERQFVSHPGGDTFYFTCADTLRELQAQKGCYVLANERYSMAVYRLDDKYYFVEPMDGEVYWILRFDSQPTEEKRRAVESIEQVFPFAAESNGGSRELCAEAYVWDEYVKNLSALDIKIEHDRVFLNGIPYDTITYVENFRHFFRSSLLEFAYAEDETFDTLVTLEMQNGCYLLENQNGDTLFDLWLQKTGEAVAVYNVNGVYYFVNFVERYPSREVVLVHKLDMREIQ